jgi:hypothetical protein
MRIARVLGLERFLTLFETPRPDSGWSHRASHDLGWTLSRQEAAILRELDRRPATADSFQEDDRRRSHHLAGVDEVLHVVLDTVAAIAPALREFVALLGTLETPRWSFGEGREGFAVGRNALELAAPILRCDVDVQNYLLETLEAHGLRIDRPQLDAVVKQHGRPIEDAAGGQTGPSIAVTKAATLLLRARDAAVLEARRTLVERIASHDPARLQFLVLAGGRQETMIADYILADERQGLREEWLRQNVGTLTLVARYVLLAHAANNPSEYTPDRLAWIADTVVRDVQEPATREYALNQLRRLGVLPADGKRRSSRIDLSPTELRAAIERAAGMAHTAHGDELAAGKALSDVASSTADAADLAILEGLWRHPGGGGISYSKLLETVEKDTFPQTLEALRGGCRRALGSLYFHFPAARKPARAAVLREAIGRVGAWLARRPAPVSARRRFDHARVVLDGLLRRIDERSRRFEDKPLEEKVVIAMHVTAVAAGITHVLSRTEGARFERTPLEFAMDTVPVRALVVPLRREALIRLLAQSFTEAGVRGADWLPELDESVATLMRSKPHELDRVVARARDLGATLDPAGVRNRSSQEELIRWIQRTREAASLGPVKQA